MNKREVGPGLPSLADLLDPRFFKALCDTRRIALLDEIARSRGALTVSQLAGCCPIDLSVVSRHLAILRDAGILRADRRGKEVNYRLSTASLVQTLRSLADALEACCSPPESEEIPS